MTCRTARGIKLLWSGRERPRSRQPCPRARHDAFPAGCPLSFVDAGFLSKLPFVKTESVDSLGQGKPAEESASCLMSVIGRRVSCRAYATDPVPEKSLGHILEAARLAPSACNQQPWRFAVVREGEARRRIVEDGFLPGIRMDWALVAPVHVVIGMETSFLTHQLAASVSGVDYPWVDIGIAGEHLVLAATELGLGTCWIGWIRPRVVAQIVGWPKSIKPVVVITVGYPHESEAPRPTASRRKPLADLVKWL